MIITVAIALTFIVMALILRAIIKDWLNPAITMPLVWGCILLTGCIAVFFGYLAVEIDALPIIALGVVSFAIGSLIATLQYKDIKPKNIGHVVEYFNYKRLIMLCIVLHLILVPLSIREIILITGGETDLFKIAWKLRYLSVTGEEVANPLVGNYLLSGFVFMPIIFIGAYTHRCSLMFAVFTSLPWVLLSLLMSGRSALAGFSVSLFYLYIVAGKRINVKNLLLFLFFFVFIIFSGAQLVGKTESNIEDGALLVLKETTESFFDYTLQGPILFSKSVDDASIKSTWDTLDNIYHIGNLLGVIDYKRQLHQNFNIYSKDGKEGNVYSLFFSIYPHYQYFGVFFFFLLYGYLSAFHHMRTLIGASLVDVLISANLFFAILISFYNDAFGNKLYFFIKLILLTKVIEFVCYRKKNNSTDTGQQCPQSTISLGSAPEHSS